MFSVITDRFTKSMTPKNFNPAINAGEITMEEISNNRPEKACVVSIALCGQAFTHRIQLSQVYDQNGRSLIISIAFTGH